PAAGVLVHQRQEVRSSYPPSIRTGQHANHAYRPKNSRRVCYAVSLVAPAKPQAMTVGLLNIEPGSRNVFTEAAGPLRLVPLTVEQYHRMIDAGILDEDSGIELLDGMLVPNDRGDVGADPM